MQDITDAERKAQMIAALIAERADCTMKGFEDRVAEVDEQLRAFGHEAEVRATRAAKRVIPSKEAETR